MSVSFCHKFIKIRNERRSYNFTNKIQEKLWPFHLSKLFPWTSAIVFLIGFYGRCFRRSTNQRLFLKSFLAAKKHFRRRWTTRTSRKPQERCLIFFLGVVKFGYFYYSEPYTPIFFVKYSTHLSRLEADQRAK